MEDYITKSEVSFTGEISGIIDGNDKSIDWRTFDGQVFCNNFLRDEDISYTQRLALSNLYSAITTQALKEFVLDAFSNSNFIKTFIKYPASKSHHHNYEGGLFDHSIECAEIILKQDFESLLSRDLSIVGALFHDAGKVWFGLEPNISRSARYLLHHDLLTINVLSQPLTNLRKKWPDGEITLIYIWTWQLNFQKTQYPMMIEAELVKQADRASVMKNSHEMAFKNKEKWRQFSNLYSGGKPTRCWRPKSST